MLTFDTNQIDAQLSQAGWFEESIVRDIRFAAHGVDVYVSLVQVRGADQELLIAPRIKTLRFHIVREFSFLSGLSTVMMHNVDNLNWGLNEIDLIAHESDAEWHAFQLIWSFGRRVIIACQGFEMLDGVSQLPACMTDFS